jgi:hypothetical protein
VSSGRDGLQIWRGLRIYRIGSRGQPKGGSLSAWNLGGEPITLIVRKNVLRNVLYGLGLELVLARTKHQKIQMRFEKWTVRSLYRTDALKTAARDLGKCKLDLVSVLDV